MVVTWRRWSGGKAEPEAAQIALASPRPPCRGRREPRPAPLRPAPPTAPPPRDHRPRVARPGRPAPRNGASSGPGWESPPPSSLERPRALPVLLRLSHAAALGFLPTYCCPRSTAARRPPGTWAKANRRRHGVERAPRCSRVWKMHANKFSSPSAPVAFPQPPHTAVPRSERGGAGAAARPAAAACWGGAARSASKEWLITTSPLNKEAACPCLVRNGREASLQDTEINRRTFK